MHLTDIPPFTGLRIQWAAMFFATLLAGHCAARQLDSARVTRPPRIRWILSLDTRKTIIERKHIAINGVLTGVGFGRHKVTVGYYWLNYGSKQRLITLHKRIANSINLAYYTRADVRFASAAYWYPWFKNRQWTVSIPVETGVGQLSARYRTVSENDKPGTKHFDFIPFQLGVYGEYKITPWVGMDLQIGYRDAIYRGPFRNHFKGPYYSYGLTLYPGRIYKDLKTYLSKTPNE